MYVLHLLVWIINQINVFCREVITVIATGIGLRMLVTFKDCLLYTKPAQTFMWCRKVRQKLIFMRATRSTTHRMKND